MISFLLKEVRLPRTFIRNNYKLNSFTTFVVTGKKFHTKRNSSKPFQSQSTFSKLHKDTHSKVYLNGKIKLKLPLPLHIFKCNEIIHDNLLKGLADCSFYASLLSFAVNFFFPKEKQTKNTQVKGCI